MPVSANVPYNPTQVTPDEGVPNDAMHVQTDGNTFGANIGQAMEHEGAVAHDVGTKYVQMATEASANDKIVNQWAPTATGLAQDYYSKQGKDAIAGFDPYIQGLQDQREKMLANSSPAEAQILNQYMTRHIAQEYDGGMRHQVQQMDVYENQMSGAFVDQQTKNAVNAGSNPDMINTAIQSGAARIQVHGIDRGQSPDVIQQQQNDFIGKTSQSVIQSAVSRGDLPFANSFYANNKENIPGAQQVDIDRVLHTENLRTWASSAVDAATSGMPLPHPANGGAQTTDVKATVAGTAQSSGVDPNSSLMIAGLESSFGQNVGSRGDVGQTGKPAADLNEQAKNLVDAQKQAQDAADKVVGGKAAPWQMYTVYQQGQGGGVALLDPQNADKKAVDVVSQFYKNPQDAKDAILKNGGNVTMTSTQFTDMLKQKCDTVYGQVKCDTAKPDGTPIDLSKAIVDPHQNGGTAVQPATTPVKALQQFDSQYPAMLQQAQSIPNLDQRDAYLQALEKKHSIFQGASNAYTSNLVNQSTQLMADPKFSMDNVTPEMYTALATDHPQTLIAMQNRARENLERGDPSAKETLEKGPAFHQLNVGTEYGSQTKTTPEMINQAYNSGQINSGAQDYLLNKVVGKKSLSPDEETYKKNALALAKSRINPGGNIDSDGLAHYSDFTMALDSYVDNAKSDGKSVHDIYSSKNLDGLIKNFEPDYNSTLPAPVEHKGFMSNLFSSASTGSAPPRQQDLVSGQTYNIPNRGKMKWTGTGFVSAGDQ